MTATETLKYEHQIILLVVDAAEGAARSIEETRQVHAEALTGILDFFSNFIDRCHHQKEEHHLFPKLWERGMPAGSGPTAVMLQEHEEGRQRLRAMAEALPQAIKGDTCAMASLRDNLLAYARLLRGHIQKEDNVLYPMADRLLLPDDQRMLNEAFEKVEAEEIGQGVHERYHRFAHDLARH